jgi:mannose-6-phosphate isomerase-like protein (cupin superfamily)
MNLIPILKEQLLDYNNYEQGLLKVIGYPGYPISDCTVCNVMSYSEWINTYHTYPVIKVEGIESIQQIRQHYNNCTNIHLFVNQHFGFSFNWHKDDVNVRLSVLKGKKTVWIKEKKYILHTSQSVIITKGYLHRVCSQKDTWALSVGY